MAVIRKAARISEPSKVRTIALSISMMTLLFAGCGQTAQNPTESNAPAQNSEPTAPPESESPSDEAQSPSGSSIVYMTTDISPEGLMAVYEALGGEPTGNVAVKVHTGEPGGQNFLRPECMGRPSDWAAAHTK